MFRVWDSGNRRDGDVWRGVRVHPPVAYYNEHKAEGFTIIVVEAGDPVAAVSQFVQIYNLRLQIWLDPKRVSLRVFGNGALSNSHVIDAVTLEKYLHPY